MKKRALLAAAVLSLVALTGCSQGGGDCGGILQYCEPEESSSTDALSPDEATTLGAPGAVPPGRVASDLVGDVTLVGDVVGPDGQYPGTGVSMIVEHTLVNKNDIPVVQDPFNKSWFPSPYGFDVPRTPFSYTVDILSDTEKITFTLTAILPVGGKVSCVLGHGPVPIPASAREATVITDIGAGRGSATVDCVYIVGM